MPPAGGVPSPQLRGSDSDASSLEELPESRGVLSLSLPPGALPGRLSLGLETSLTSVLSSDSTLEFHDAPLGEDREEEDVLVVSIKTPQDGETEKSVASTDEEEEEEEEEDILVVSLKTPQDGETEKSVASTDEEEEKVEEVVVDEEEEQQKSEEDAQGEMASQEDEKTVSPRQAQGAVEEEVLETRLEEEEEDGGGGGAAGQQDMVIDMDLETCHIKVEEVLRPAADQGTVDAVVCDARVEDLDRTEKTFEYSEFTEHLEVTQASEPQHEPTELLEPTTGEGEGTVSEQIFNTK